MGLLDVAPAGAVPPPVVENAMRAELRETGALSAYGFLLRFFPVFDFQRQAVAALFCAPMHSVSEALNGHRAFHDIAPAEWAQIDCAILDHALAFAGRLASNGIIAAVGASVGFPTLNDPGGRAVYRDALRAVHAREHAYLVIKIEDIPEQTPLRRIGELVAALKLHAPRVWVHLPGSRFPISGREPLHASGLVHSMPARLPYHGMQSEARWLARQAMLQSALACMDSIDTPAELDAARAAGIRFMAGRALDRSALAGDAPIDDVRDALYAGLERQ